MEDTIATGPMHRATHATPSHQVHVYRESFWNAREALSVCLKMQVTWTLEVVAHIRECARQLTAIEEQGLLTAASLRGKWTGDDADAFQAEMTGEVGPRMQALVSTVEDFGKRIEQAMDVIQQADNQAMQTVAKIQDVYRRL
jgi:WXG100 family type VII secretion target